MIWTFHRRLWFVAAIHTFIGEAGPFLSGVTNYFQPFVMHLANTSIQAHYGIELDDASYAWSWSMLTAVDTVGNFVGAALIGLMLDNIGRKPTVMGIRNTVSTVSCICMGLAQPLNSIELLAVGRFLTGFCGACSNAMYMFLAECAPHNVRGTMPMLLGMGSGFWELLATVVALPQLLGTQALWPYFMIIPIIPNCIHTIYAFIFPESPKYLYIYKGDRLKTAKSLKFYYGDDTDVEHEMEHLEKEHQFAPAKTMSYSKIFSIRHLRIPFLICIVAALSGIFNGQQLSNQYSSAILVLLGIPRQYSLLVILFNMIISAVLGFFNAIWLIERVGRRRCQLINVGIALCGSFCLFLAEVMNPQKNLAATSAADAHLPNSSVISMILGFTGFLCISLSYGLGIVTIPKLLVGELCPQATRGRTATAVYMITNTVNLVIVLFWPPLQTAVNGYSILPITIGEVVCFVLLYLYLPETHNRPVSDIIAQWYRPEDGKPLEIIPDVDESCPLLSDEVPVVGYANEKTLL